MSRVNKLASSMGTAALVLSGSAFAAGPVAFDSWSVTAGAISTGACPTGFSCGEAIVGSGFYQREITNTSTSESFFQTIITEDAATATSANLDSLVFGDESFVSTSNASGLADNQRISQTAGTESFQTTSNINSGWAGNELNVEQHVVDSVGDGFRTDFFLGQATDSAGLVVGTRMKVSSEVGLGGSDAQKFALIEKTGDYNNTGDGAAALSGSNGGALTWTLDNNPVSNDPDLGEDIKAVWVGQDLTIDGVPTSFGFTSFENVDTTASISESSTSSSAAIGWETTTWGVNSLNTTGTGF